MPLIERVRQAEEKKKKQAQPVNKTTPKIVPKAPNALNASARSTDTAKRYSSGNKYNLPATPKTSSFSTRQPNSPAGVQYNYTSKGFDQWSAADFTAYGRMTGDTGVFDYLYAATNDRSNRLWNPYRGGRTTVTQDAVQWFKDRYGYEGPFDQQFIDQFRPIIGDHYEYTDTNSISKPGKKDPPERWDGYYFNLISHNVPENLNTIDQWNECRNAYYTAAKDFEKIWGRKPTYQEFEGFVDRSKYNMLEKIDNSFASAYWDNTVPVLPMGTYYSPDVIPGLYQAYLNGEDLKNDRDYFEDAVQYAMSPVQSTPSMKKYSWSGDNLGEHSQEDRDTYVAKLRSTGNYEEAEAYSYACWAADQKARGVDVEAPMLNEAFGYYMDDAFFDRVDEAIGDEYQKYLNYDGTLKAKSKNPTTMELLCREYYDILKLRDATDEAEADLNEYKANVTNLFNANAENYATADDFYNAVKTVFLDDTDSYKAMKKYIKDEGDMRKYCRQLPISDEALKNICFEVYRGHDVINSNIDYGVTYDEDLYDHFEHTQPAAEPIFYAASQASAAQRRLTNQNNAVKAATDAVVSLADSGVPVSKGELPVYSDTAVDIVGDGFSGLLSKIWYSVRNSKYVEKLGDAFTVQDAAAIDPVLNQLDYEMMTDELTLADIEQIASAEHMARINDEPISLSTGIIGYAIPGSQHIMDAMANGVVDVRGLMVKRNMKFNVGAYKSVYEDRVENGYSEEDAAGIAIFAATDLNSANESMATGYEEDQTLNAAAQRVATDVAAEEGSKDTYALLKGINDDVSQFVADNNITLPSAAMNDLNKALLLGTSDSADAAFRARTNQILHDVSTGTITPEDIAEGVLNVPLFNDTELAVGKLNRSLANRTNNNPIAQAAQQTIRTNTGVVITEDDYETYQTEAKSIMDADSSFLSSGNAFNNISDGLKAVIDYDALVDYANTNGFDVDNVVRDAIDSFVNPDKKYHTNYKMDGLTDFSEQITALGQNKSEDQIASNAEAAQRSTFQKIIEDDRYDLLPAIMAFVGREQSDGGKLVDMFRTYGKWFSANEVSQAFSAFAKGEATYSEIENLVSQRVSRYPSGYLNAINNPELLDASYTRMRNGVDNLRRTTAIPGNEELASRFLSGEGIGNIVNEYPEAFQNVDLESIQSILEMKGTLSDDEIAKRIARELDRGETQESVTRYSEEQINGINALIDFAEAIGPSSFYLAALDNATIKELSDGAVDLDAAGFKYTTAAELMSLVDPKWMQAYGVNPGSDDPMYAMFGGVSGGLRSMLSLPSKAMAFLSNTVNKAIDSDYDPRQYNGIFSGATNAFNYIDQNVSGYDQNVATQAEAFIRQGVSEFTRNLLTSAAGGALADFYTKGMMSALSGMPLAGSSVQRLALDEAIAGMAGWGKAVEQGSTMLGRSVFASSVFFNTADEELRKGSSSLTATVKGLLSAGIELGTEDLGLEKMYSFNVNGVAFTEHIANGMQGIGGVGAYWVANTVRSILSEISEEEASEILGRVVDFGQSALYGNGIEQSFAESFDGLPEAMKATALSTAFTTLLFGAADLGGMTYNIIRSHSMDNTVIDRDELFRAVVADIYSAMDEVDESDNDITVGENDEVETNDKQVEPTESAENTNAAPISETSASSNDQELASTETTSEAPSTASQSAPEAEAKPYNPATDVPTFKSPVDAALDKVEKAAAKAYKNPSPENTKAYQEANQAFNDAVEQEKLEAAQQAVEAELDPNTQEQEQPSPELPEGAQRVSQYMKDSSAAMDNAVVNKAGDIAAEQVSNDPGLKAKQDAIEKAQLAIQQVEQQINEKAKELDVNKAQTQQMFRAAADENIDPASNAEQIFNARNKKIEQRNATQAEMADLQQKNEEAKEKVKQDQEALDRERQEKEAAEREKAKQDALKKLEEQKQKAAEKLFGTSDPNATKWDVRNGAKSFFESNFSEENQKVENRQMAEASGQRVISDYTNKQAEAEKKAFDSDNQTRTNAYAERFRAGQTDSQTLEDYTNPATFPSVSVEQIDEDDWKNVGTEVRDAKEAEEERKARMEGDYDKYRSENFAADIVAVPKWAYDVVNEKFSNGNKLDRRYGYQSFENDEDVNTDHPFASDYFDINSLISPGGTVSELAGDIIALSDPDFNTRPYANRSVTGGSGPVLKRLTENEFYVVLTPEEDTYFSPTKSVADREKFETLTNPKFKNNRADKKSGIQRAEDAINDPKTGYQVIYDKALKAYADAAERLDQATISIDAAMANRDPVARKQAAEAYKAAIDRANTTQSSLNAAYTTLTNAQKKLNEFKKFVADYEVTPTNDEAVYYIIDKETFKFSPDKLWGQAVLDAQNELEQHPVTYDNAYQIINLLVNEDPRLAYGKSKLSFTEFTGENSGDTLYRVNPGDTLPKVFGHYSDKLGVTQKEYNDLSYSEYVRLVRDEYESLTLDELKAKYYESILKRIAKNLGTNEIKNSVKVLTGDRDIALEDIDAFVEKNGGYAKKGVGGPGEFQFSDREAKSGYFLTDEGVFKGLTKEQRDRLGIKRTVPQYNILTRRAIQQYADDNGLSPQDAAYLYGTRKVEMDRDVGNARIVHSNDQAALAVSKKTVDSPGKNMGIKDSIDGYAYSTDLAIQRLKDELTYIMQATDLESNGGEPVDLGDHSIYVYLSETGKDNKRHVGEFYTDKDGKTERWFPTMEQLMGCYKIVCNFPYRLKQNGHFNLGDTVNFTLFPDQESNEVKEANLNRQFGSGLEYNKSELAYTRANKELKAEFERVAKLYTQWFDKTFDYKAFDYSTAEGRQQFFERINGSSDMQREFATSLLNAMYNISMNRLQAQMKYIQNCHPDKIMAMREKIIDQYLKVQDFAGMIRGMEEKSAMIQAERTSENENFIKTGHREWVDYTPTTNSVSTDTRTWSQKLEDAKNRLDELNKEMSTEGRHNPIRQGSDFYESERMFLENLIPTLEAKAQEESTQEDTPQQPTDDTRPESTIPESLGETDDITRLATLKTLQDSGENVTEQRSTAIRDFHNARTAEMSLNEKVAYYTALAREAENGNSSFQIDPNVDYNEIAKDYAEQLKQLNKTPEAKTLKRIIKAAPTYKSMKGVSQATTTLDRLESMGFDVSAAREAVEARREALSTPADELTEAAVEAAPDESTRIDLQFHSQDTPQEVVETTMEEVAPYISPAVTDMFENMQDPDAPVTMTTGFESLVEGIQDSNRLYLHEEELAELKNNIIELTSTVKNRTSELNDISKSIHDLSTQIDQIQKRLEEISQGVEQNGFEDAFAAEYNQLNASLRTLQSKIADRRTEKAELTSAANDARQQLKYLSTIYSTNNVQQQILSGQTAFTPDEIIGPMAMDRFKDGRLTSKGMAAKAMQYFSKGSVYGKETIIPAEELGEFFKTIADEKEMAFNSQVARAANNALKDRKSAAIMLQAGKEYINALNGDYIDPSKLTSIAAKAAAEINKLSRLTGMTDEDLRRESRNKRFTARAVNDWLEYVHTMVSENNKNSVYKLFDNQLEVLNNNIEQAQSIVDMSFDISADSLTHFFDGTKGGHVPVPIMKLMVGCVFEGMRKQNGKMRNDIMPITNLAGGIDRIIDKYCGPYGQILKSILVAPVNKANAEIAKHLADIERRAKAVQIKDKNVEHLLAGALHYGLNAESMRSMYNDLIKDAASVIGTRDNKETVVQNLRDIVAKRLEELPASPANLPYKDMTTLMIDTLPVWEGGMTTKKLHDIAENAIQSVVKAQAVHSEIYNQELDGMNVSLANNGQPIVKKHGSYYPNEIEEKDSFFRKMGINTHYDEISAAIFGLTGDTTAVKQFNPHMLERSGNGSILGLNLNAHDVLMNYCRFASSVIYQTSNIVRGRDFVEALAGQKQARRQSVNDGEVKQGPVNLDFTDEGELKLNQYGPFVVEVRKWLDALAGKHPDDIDKAFEKQFKRKFYSVLTSMKTIQAYAKVGLNARTAVLNAVPVTYAASIFKKTALPAVYQTIGNSIYKQISGVSDGVFERSDFGAARLTNFNEDKQFLGKIGQIGFKPIEITDRIATEMIYRMAYYDGLNKGLSEHKAQVNADQFCKLVMGSKVRGDKPDAFNSFFGSTILQFKQEPINNLFFWLQNAKGYAAGNNPSAIKAIAKMLSSLIFMSFYAKGINWILGSDATISPIDSIQNAVASRKQGDSIIDTSKAAISNLADSMNPVDNLTSGKIFDVPVVSAVTDLAESVPVAAKGIWDVLFEDHSDTDPDWSWTDKVTKAVLNFVPFGAQINRTIDTTKALARGYATNSSGKTKFAFDATPGNIIRGYAFGVNSTPAAKEYNQNSFRAWTDKKNEEVMKLSNLLGITVPQAEDIYEDQQKLTKSESYEEAATIRQDTTVPPGLSDSAMQNINAPYVTKGIELFKQSGLETYPQNLKFKTEKKDGVKTTYFVHGNNKYPVDEQTIEAMNRQYDLLASTIISSSDDPAFIEKKLKALPGTLKKQFIKGGE